MYDDFSSIRVNDVEAGFVVTARVRDPRQADDTYSQGQLQLQPGASA